MSMHWAEKVKGSSPRHSTGVSWRSRPYLQIPGLSPVGELAGGRKKNQRSEEMGTDFRRMGPE